jgi:hypothetical protein
MWKGRVVRARVCPLEEEAVPGCDGPLRDGWLSPLVGDLPRWRDWPREAGFAGEVDLEGERGGGDLGGTELRGDEAEESPGEVGECRWWPPWSMNGDAAAKVHRRTPVLLGVGMGKPALLVSSSVVRVEFVELRRWVQVLAALGEV